MTERQGSDGWQRRNVKGKRTGERRVGRWRRTAPASRIPLPAGGTRALDCTRDKSPPPAAVAQGYALSVREAISPNSQ